MTLTDLRAGAYIRVSSDEQKDNHSPDFQLEHCQRKVASLDGTIIDIYRDLGLSGKDDKRPELQRMMRDARAGRINCVVIYNLSRLSRNTRITLTLKEEFEKLGVALYSATEMFDDSPTGEFAFTLHAAEAQSY